MVFSLLKLRRHQTDIGDGIPGILSGAFDLQGDRLSGHVERVPYSSNVGMKVLAMRGVQVLAECDAADIRGNRNMPFTMPLDGRFTVSELAREAVLIKARNPRGDTGTLTMNGATRIELIREHIGIPVTSILELDFSRQGNAGQRLGAGWAPAEEEFTWTVNDDSFIRLPCNGVEGVCWLRFKCGTFITPFAPRQLMEIFINDYPIGSYTEDQPLPHFREFRVQAADLGRADSPVIRLHHPYAARPCDHSENGDRRRLAYRFYRMSLVREI